MVPRKRGDHDQEIPNRHRLIVHIPSQKVRQAPDTLRGLLHAGRRIYRRRHSLAEYHLDSWRCQILSRLRLVNAEPRTGDNQVHSLQLRLRRSKCRSGNCNLHQRPMSSRSSSASGANETGTDAISQNGCSKHGISPSTHISAAPHNRPLPRFFPATPHTPQCRWQRLRLTRNSSAVHRFRQVLS